jgi:hypothetical protein
MSDKYRDEDWWREQVKKMQLLQIYKKKAREKEILEELEAIGVAIEDSYNTAVDTSENSDSMYYIDLARNLVEKLMVSVEGEKVTLDEVMNTSPALAKLL